MSRLAYVVIAACCLLVSSCSDEPGRVRVSKQELVGRYVAQFDAGTERLELQSDGTYLQSFSGRNRKFVNSGKWLLHNGINSYWDGSEIELLGFDLSDRDPTIHNPNQGVQNLQVHRTDGKIRLALNEAFDWYFERVN
jgi:hypothetical protein